MRFSTKLLITAFILLLAADIAMPLPSQAASLINVQPATSLLASSVQLQPSANSGSLQNPNYGLQAQ